MKCSFCGTENAPGRTHCIACGTPLPITQNNLMVTGVPAGGGMSEPVPAAPVPSPTPPAAVPETPRVEVEYAPHEVAEVEMPTSQIKNETPESFVGTAPEPTPAPVPASTLAPSSLITPVPAQSILPSEEGRPGPWLALSVLGVGVVVVIGIIYFGYQLIFGGPAPTPTPLPTVTSIPTTVPTTVTPTPTVAPVMPPNDLQREKDITDLQAALEKYFTDKGKYPKATNYSSMLNSLISGQYLTRRIQDPLFPTQQYQYTVDPDQKAYELAINFETNLSTLLSGGSTTYRFRSPAKS